MAKLQIRSFSMKGKYEVGYGKPPKASRFGNRPQPDRTSKSKPAKEAAIFGDTINGLMRVAHNGRVVRMHPHEAMLHGLTKSGLRGKVRAIKEFFLACRKADLLNAPAGLMGGILTVPKGMPSGLAARLVRIAGRPPWDDELYAQCKAEYERDCQNIEGLTEQEKARRDAEAK